MKLILFIFAGLLLSDCASYDVGKKRIDVGPAPGAGIRAAVDDVQEKSAERKTGTISFRDLPYQKIKRPSQMSDLNATEWMIDNLHLEVLEASRGGNPTLYMMMGATESDLSLGDQIALDLEREALAVKASGKISLLRNDKVTGGVYGVLDIPGTISLREVSIIDGPADLRSRPDGAIIGSIPDARVVGVFRKFGPWRFVSDAEDSAWIHENNLKKVPSAVLYARSFTANNNFDADLKKWIAENSELGLIKKNELEGKCPEGVTDAEKDGFFSADKKLHFISTRRTNAYRNCQKNWVNKKVPVGTLKISPCPCLDYVGGEDIVEGWVEVRRDAKYWKEFTLDNTCEEGHHFRICKPSFGVETACRKECF